MAVHVAGHVVARLYLDLGTPETITIDAPDGVAIAWCAAELPDQTEGMLLGQLLATLAGRAAEEEIIGSVGASAGGSSSDLAIATGLAFEMEATLGFAAKWPLLCRATDDRTLLLALDADLAQHVNTRLEFIYAKAREAVRDQREAILFLARHVFEHGTLDGARLAQLVAETRERIIE